MKQPKTVRFTKQTCINSQSYFQKVLSIGLQIVPQYYNLLVVVLQQELFAPSRTYCQMKQHPKVGLQPTLYVIVFNTTLSLVQLLCFMKSSRVSPKSLKCTTSKYTVPWFQHTHIHKNLKPFNLFTFSRDFVGITFQIFNISVAFAFTVCLL